jgi:uncharacterized protein (TIGR03086 family)
MDIETFSRAAKSTSSVLAGVEPSAMEDPTPCASWTVRELLNHVVGGLDFFAVIAETGRPPERTEGDYTAGDFAGGYQDAAERFVRALSAPGAMERTYQLPIGEVPAKVVLGIASTDTFVHGWDLARATGQSSDLDPDLAVSLLANARRSVTDGFRGEDGKSAFGPELDPPPGASAADELAAFLGRHV